ncbi:DNA binding domain protein, excisionase family [Desulfosarcina variabilis str. Montpellier]
MFSRHIVERWMLSNKINDHYNERKLPSDSGLLVIAGSDDILFEKMLSIFNSRYSGHMAVFGNLGSLGGINALRNNLCHLATSHLIHDNGKDYNFDFLKRQFIHVPVVVNFCKRDQGILLQKGNPLHIKRISDLARPGLRIVNRSLSTGTRLLFDRELKKAGLAGKHISGYRHEVNRHMDVGIEVLSGRADAGPGIRPVSFLLGLDFLPLRQERYDLLITHERFFDQDTQNFLSMLHEQIFIEAAKGMAGYDISQSGKMFFPHELEPEAGGKSIKAV